MGQVSVRRAPDGETRLAKLAAANDITPSALARDSGLAVNTVRSMLSGGRAARLTNARKVTESMHRLACRLPDVEELFDLTEQTANQIDGARS